jgi:transposase
MHHFGDVSNILKVSMQTTVIALHSLGHSIRQIARQTGINRRTVRRYIGAADACLAASKCTTSTPKVATGSVGPEPPKCTTHDPKVAAGSRSRCEPWRDIIEASIEAGLTAERIWQDLRSGHGFEGAYNSVRRFVAGLRSSQPRRVWRVECVPGEELQIDFMAGPMLPDPAKPDKRRRCWLLRAVLSHSRKGYTEAVWRQDSESFLRALENALRAFGGVPVMLNLDNLKAAVKRADWFDPELSPKFAAFCRHYGITPMPCRPYSPQHKGKVERSVQHVRHNALAGREFTSLSELNTHLHQWEQTVADTRIHGTTRRQVGEHFTTSEKPALKPLPQELFPAFTETKRLVGRDGYVEVAKAYYQAPPEFIGRNVWVRHDGRQVRIFDASMEQIACHTRIDPGRYSSVRGVRGLDQAGSVESTLRYWQSKVEAIGPNAGRWAKRAVTERGAEATRSLMGMSHLLKKHRASHLEQACIKALEHSAADNPSLRTIRQHLPSLGQDPEPSHPIIRELFVYGQFVQTQTTNTQSTITPHQHAHESHQHHEDPSTQTAPQHPGSQP